MDPSPQLSSQVAPIDTQRHFLAVFFLSFMVGTFGIDRFYLGKIGTGIVKLLTLGGLGLWTLIDLVLIMSGSMRDAKGQPMREFDRYKKFAAKTVLLFAVGTGVVVLLTGATLIGAAYFVVTQFQDGGGLLENLMPTDILNSIDSL